MTQLYDNWYLIELDKLVKADWNYKNEDELTQSKLDNNVQKNGQVQNIIVRELDNGMYEICNGNHRLQSFQKKGLSQVIAYNLGKVSVEEGKRLAIETNETRFEPDNAKLAKLLEELKLTYELPELSGTMPFNENELTAFHEAVNFDWNNIPTELEKPQNEEQSVESKPKSELEDDRMSVYLLVNKQVGEGFKDQLNRVKRLLYPNEEVQNVSDTIPLQVITQILAELEDNRVTSKMPQ